MNAFHADPAVRQRLVEYLGGDTLENATAFYITHSDGCAFQRPELHPPTELNWFLDQELDIARSLADRESLLLHLDVEYVNFDSPGEAYVDPWRTFDLQEPTVRAIEAVLCGLGIAPLHLITGQGHHFVWRVRQSSAVAQKIAALDPAPELVRECAARAGGPLCSQITAWQQQAFSGIALLMEYVAQRVKAEASPASSLPVEITAVHVGPGQGGRREMISIDISEYGDPLHTRMVRMPFTNYLKPWITGLARDLGIEAEVPLFRAIPLHEMDVRQAIKFRQDEGDVLELARRAGVRIPLQEEGTDKLLECYLASPLRRFHNGYYAEKHDLADLWPATYGSTPLEALPYCVRDILEWPNDRLLKPAGLQMIARTFLAEGWHPRHIAGLIRSKLADPRHGWGVDWQDYEPGTRADFYTRLFTGQWAAGLDGLVDFNCTSTQEKGFCPSAGASGCTLSGHRDRIAFPPPL
ncbi:MAG: hypothetical protein JWL81_503 [Verrucomicrobiales bacterium]|nr:hypothetical protein [Verrucomicrobiales bacterium]